MGLLRNILGLPLALFGMPLGVLRRFGTLVGPLVGVWGAFGFLSDAFGLPLALVCDPFGRPGGPFGYLGLPSAVF